MYAEPGISVSGDRELIAALKSMGNRVGKQAYRRAANLAMLPVLQAARNLCPSRPAGHYAGAYAVG